jgi:MYXO-CTERM domain-containing protein
VTGGSSMPSLSVLIGGLALLVLAAAAFVTRRRTA